MIIVILGILAAVAVPKYFDLQASAKLAAEKGVVGGVRAGIYTLATSNRSTGTTPIYPLLLDSVAASAACSGAAPCFTNVLDQGAITSDWSKGTSTVASCFEALDFLVCFFGAGTGAGSLTCSSSRRLTYTV